MRAIHRKLWRDLWKIRGQALAIALCVAAGLTVFVMYLSNFQSLRLTQHTYYDRFAFADVFASLKRAPNHLAARIAEIPGVAVVETRVVVDVSLDVPGLSEPAVGRLISLPENRLPALNQLFLRSGRYLTPGRPDEVLISESFALARHLDPGDTLDAVINGRLHRLDIVGIALSPEYVYSIRPGEILPDDSRFGILWMGYQGLATAFDLVGGFNDVTLKLTRTAQLPSLMAELDRLLEPYGGLGAIPRAQQLSHWYLDNELRQLQSFGLIIPILFLAVAAFLLNVVLTRMVTVQREQIAALKALGYSNREVGFHYAGWSLAIATVGEVVGLVSGARLGAGLVSLYNDFFRFPLLLYRLSPALLLASIAISTAAALLGALGAVRAAVRLPPAEAMRPQAPALYRESRLERWGLRLLPGQPARIVLRNLLRRPWRAATSVVGISAAAAIFILGTFFIDAMHEMLDVLFNVIQRHDVMVTMSGPSSARALHELQHMPGVVSVEPLRAIPCRLRFGHRSRQVAIIGLDAAARLNRVIDASLRVVTLPEQGLVLSTKLASLLGVRAGDSVTVEVLTEGRPVRRIVVASLVEEYMGTNAYMEIGAANRLLREGETLSGAFLQVEASAVDALNRRLKLTPRIAGVALKRAAMESFEKTIGQNLNVMIFFNIIFATIIAFGVVYNTARVSLSERAHELATLRVIGFTHAEISSILLGELAIVVGLAVPVGLALGQGLAWFMASVFDNELYRIPAVVTAGTRARAALTILSAGVISGMIVRRRLRGLDLVAVLKTRE